LVTGALVEERWVGIELEGLTRELVKIFVHGGLSLALFQNAYPSVTNTAFSR
jgi:hypothetical protein